MDRLVELRFQGRFDQFFNINYKISDSASKVIGGGVASLPPCLELVENIKAWRKCYYLDIKSPRLESIEGEYTNSSDINHWELLSNLKKSLNDWLNSPEFLPVKDNLMSRLNFDQVILVGIDMPDPELKYAPWHLWDLFRFIETPL
jgi:hypothetical protein